ncbi:MAG: type II toxin-antitoxin system VapC family toxin [Planctomycetota bacterium]
MERTFVDTGAWVALVNQKDHQNVPVGKLVRQWAGRLVTSNHVADEAVTLARFRVGHRSAAALGQNLLDGTPAQLVRLTPEDEAEALRLFRERPDQRYSFTDCTSFVLMRRMGIDVALTLDSDFLREGFEVIPS